MVFVSVVIPVYNTSQYLRECLGSVLEQTLNDIEIITVNDGSTDNSLEILNEYAQRDSRIKVVDKANGGLASAYNRGQRMATGKYIYFLDSDDWLEKDALEILYRMAEEKQVELVKSYGFYAETHNESDLSVMVPLIKCNKVIRNMLFIPEFVARHVAQWTVLYRRDFLIKNHIWATEFPKKMAPDISFMYHVWCCCNSLYVVPKAFVHYRKDNPDSDKNSGSKMSFYLIRGHLVARDILFRIKASKQRWFIKTAVEFEHFMFELCTRCKTDRKKFILAISKIFKEKT